MYVPTVHVRPICDAEDQPFQRLMQEHHYLGALVKIGNTLRYVAELDGRCVGLLSISAPALKCAARDQWIGWDYRHQYDRLNLVANNSRFLILPGCHHKNLASQILSRLRQRIQRDWQAHFGYPLLMLETFVDPARFHGTVYRASNWTLVGSTQGYRRTGYGYSERPVSPKLVFVLPLQRNARALLARPRLDERYQTGKARMKLTAEQMVSLYDFFNQIDESLAIDGKTMCNAIGENANQTHIMSAIGHQSGQCYTQKKSARFAPRAAMRKNAPTR